MARSNIRVLALDLDGTLTNDEKIVTPRTRAALDAAAAQGVTIVLSPAPCHRKAVMNPVTARSRLQPSER